MTLRYSKMHPHTKFGIPNSKNIRDMLSTQLFLKIGQRSRSQWPKNGMWHPLIPRLARAFTACTQYRWWVDDTYWQVHMNPLYTAVYLIWACTWDFGTYGIGSSKGLCEPTHAPRLARAFTACTQYRWWVDDTYWQVHMNPLYTGKP